MSMKRYLFSLAIVAVTIPAYANKVEKPADLRYSAKEIQDVPNFRKHLVPLLGKLGCNGRACHGSFQGQGGIKGGQVVGVGESDDNATLPKDKVLSPDDAAATFFHNLRIDHTKEYHTNIGRPITIVREGHVIKELFA